MRTSLFLTLVKIPTGTDENVYAYIREKAGDKVVTIINLSGEIQKVTLESASYEGCYTYIFSGEKMELNSGYVKEFQSCEYLVLASEQYAGIPAF